MRRRRRSWLEGSHLSIEDHFLEPQNIEQMNIEPQKYQISSQLMTVSATGFRTLLRFGVRYSSVLRFVLKTYKETPLFHGIKSS